MGRGIGFQKHPKDQVDETKIEKIYAPQSKSWLKNFMLLMNDIDPTYFELTDKIISLAMKDLHTKFNEYLLISLTDHIHFAVYRHQHKMDIKNEILWEIKRIYKDEFKVALKAVSLIDKQFNIKLPEDEVGFIAIKFVENRLDNPARKNTEQITDPGNVGTIIRTADAAGFNGVVLSPESVDLYNPKTQRAMQGSQFHINLITRDLSEVITSLKHADIPVYASMLDQSAKKLSEFKPIAQLGLVIGNEAHGVSSTIADLCSEKLYIPIKGKAESLNAAVAAGIMITG